MAGRIPQSFLDELISRVDIVDVVDSYVPLKKAGKDYQACCPFHNEKTPSFTVSQDKQFYHCFGCGANGSAIGFLMEHLGMSFPEAVEELANRCGMTIPYEARMVDVDQGTSELYELMELIVRYFTRQLREHEAATKAVDYLKQRGLSGELAKNYEIGFAPPGWDNLLQEFGQSDSGKQRLDRLGMVIKKDNGHYYDRFRDRIMFPIRDPRNRVIGFGGRVMGDETPKYLNSPETAIFHKGREVYGLYQARKAHRQLETIYIVEGYMDVLALAQYDIPNSVATLGTAATQEQIEKLFKKCPKLIFCFDGDKAGRRAAWRALENTLPLLHDGRHCHFLFMPEGDDPDSFVREQGKQAFEQHPSLTILSDYLFDQSAEGLDLETPEGNVAYKNQVLPLLQKLPSGSLKPLLLQRLAQQTGIEATALDSGASPATTNKQKFRPKPGSQRLTPVRKAIRLLMNFPEIAHQIPPDTELASVDQHGVSFLVELMDYIRARPEGKVNTGNILEHWRETPIEKALLDLNRSEELLHSPEQASEECTAIIAKLIRDDQQTKRKLQNQRLTSIEQLKQQQQKKQ